MREYKSRKNYSISCDSSEVQDQASKAINEGYSLASDEGSIVSSRLNSLVSGFVSPINKRTISEGSSVKANRSTSRCTMVNATSPTDSNVPDAKTPSRNVSKMHAECCFELFCVDARIVPEILNQFAALRRITLFVRSIIPKDSSLVYFYACLVCKVLCYVNI